MLASLSSSFRNRLVQRKKSLTEIPPLELDNYLCRFILEIQREKFRAVWAWLLDEFQKLNLRNGNTTTPWLKAANFQNIEKFWRLKGKNSREKEKSENQMLLIHLQGKTECLTWQVAKNTMTWNRASWLRKQCSMARSTWWMEERISKGRDGAVAGTHSNRDFRSKMSQPRLPFFLNKT